MLRRVHKTFTKDIAFFQATTIGGSGEYWNFRGFR